MVALRIFLALFGINFILDQPDGSAVDLRLYPHAVDGHGLIKPPVVAPLPTKK